MKADGFGLQKQQSSDKGGLALAANTAAVSSSFLTKFVGIYIFLKIANFGVPS